MSRYASTSISFFIFLNQYVYLDNFSDCNCDPKGSKDLTCDTITGQCPCKYAHEGQTCNKCTPGNFGEPGNCQCNYLHNIHIVKTYNNISFSACGCKKGSLGITCDKTGKCICPVEHIGNKCEQCKEGYWGHPEKISGHSKCKGTNP